MTAYKDDAERSRERVEAWWNHEVLDRAVVLVTAPRDHEPYHEPDVDDLERYFTDPELVIPRLESGLRGTYFGGESFPVMFPVATGMVAIVANYLGCPVRFVGRNTTWAQPIIHDWDGRPELKFDPDNKWWRATTRLLEAAVERADGYHVGIPDLNGPTELLSRCRTSEKLALDFIDNPQHIKPALKEINQTWLRCWQECTKITQATGGYFYWMRIWSDLPSVDLQSDFSCMISSKMFNEYFLPFIEEQTRMVARTMYHLDGPGALQHLDALLDLPELNGIQWVPGAGGKPIVEWIPLMKRIQDAGKLIYAPSDRDSVQTLLEELKPEGLMMTAFCESVEELGDFLKKVETWTGRHG